ncbi:MAG: phosphatidylglycerol lysyltransferase domain-containing protein [Chitinispirillales bacterium]|jgi:hypothetical protein|nr:phosphatidylglycerol lysyltransferase domain-containing protein [Chitinispirillales bacterium]
MDFKKIDLDDRPVMQPYLINNPYGTCDFSFGNIFIWQDQLKTRYCIHKGYLVLRAVSLKGDTVYLMPLGLGDDGGKKEVLADMIAEAREAGEEFMLGAVTPQMEKELDEIMPGAFSFSNPNSVCDYVYLSENLRLLKGRKYSAKRNHINKFMSLYGDRYKYVEIDEGIVPLCHEMHDRWCVECDCGKSDTDFCAATKALDNMNAIGLEGGAIFVDEEMIGFTLGQPNNADTYNIIIEKALKRMEGAYAMINREFAARKCENYKLINREEDVGVQELKKAKMSYYPHILLTKGVGVLQ